MVMDIVLIPGALATSQFWHHQEQYFQGKARIHHPENFSAPSITEMADKISKTMPGKCVLVGFSLGGYIALELMRHVPHQIEKLILINSGAKAISEKGQLERTRSLELIKKGKFDFLMNVIFKTSIHDTSQHQALLPLLKSMAEEVGSERYTHQLTAILNKPNHLDVLPTIHCPTLLIASKEDKIMPPERSEHMAKCIKNSQLVYVENCGHVAPLEQPDLINKIISSWL